MLLTNCEFSQGMKLQPVKSLAKSGHSDNLVTGEVQGDV
jgi:hypothetical protein